MSEVIHDLSPLDQSFWNLDTDTTHQQIASWCRLSDVPNFNLLKERARALLSRFPRMQKRVIGVENPRWEICDNFDLNYHLCFEYSPQINCESALLSLVQRKFAEPLNLAKPLWHFTVISNRAAAEEGVVAEGEVYVGMLFVVHHAFADGVGGLKLVESFFDSTANVQQGFSRKLALQKRKAESTKIKQPLNSPKSTNQSERSRHLISLKRTSSGILRLIFEYLSPPPKTLLNGKNSSTRIISLTTIPRATIREIKHLTGASVNNIVLTLVAEAVRSYHLSRGVQLFWIRVIVPVSRRRISAKYKLGNHLTGVGLSLPLVSGDLLDLLKTVQDSAEKVSASGAVNAYLALGHLAARLPRKLQFWFLEGQGRRTNFICTNMPSAAAPKYLAGARVLKNYALAALMRNHGIAFAFVRFGGEFCVSVVADPEILKDPEVLTDNLTVAARRLLEEANLRKRMVAVNA